MNYTRREGAMPESAALALAEVAALLSNHARGDVVCQAAQLVEGLTGTKDGLDELVRGAELVVPPLVGTLVVAAAGGGGKEGGKTAEAAAAAQVQAQEEAMREHLRRAGVSCAGALVNLSQRKEMVPMLVQRGALAAAARLLARREAPHAMQGRLVLLLTNLSQDDEACRRLVGLGNDALEQLARRFTDAVAGGSAGIGSDDDEDDQMAHLASVFASITRTREGRRAVAHVDAPRKFVRFLRDGNLTRRRGVAAMLKNQCFKDQDEDGTRDETTTTTTTQTEGNNSKDESIEEEPATGNLEVSLDPISAVLDTELLRSLLRSLGAEKPMEAADEDEGVRVLLSDALLLIVQHPAGLDLLWKELDIAPKLQMCYQHEKDTEVCATYEHIANIIIAAGEEKDGTGTGGADEDVVDVGMSPLTAG